MERIHPITDLNKFNELGFRGEVYEDKFAGGDEPPQTNSIDASDVDSSGCGNEVHDAARAFAATLKLISDSEGKLLLDKPTTIVELFCGENHSATNAIKEIIANPELLRCITVDVNPKCEALVTADVRGWNPLNSLSPVAQTKRKSRDFQKK